MAKNNAIINWKNFDRLSRSYKELQIDLLESVELEDLGPKTLVKWGEVLVGCLAKAHDIIIHDKTSDALDIEHWKQVRSLSFDQLGQTITLIDSMLKGDLITAFDKALVFNFVARVSSVYYDAARALEKIENAKPKEELDLSREQLDAILELSTST